MTAKTILDSPTAVAILVVLVVGCGGATNGGRPREFGVGGEQAAQMGVGGNAGSTEGGISEDGGLLARGGRTENGGVYSTAGESSGMSGVEQGGAAAGGMEGFGGAGGSAATDGGAGTHSGGTEGTGGLPEFGGMAFVAIGGMAADHCSQVSGHAISYPCDSPGGSLAGLTCTWYDCVTYNSEAGMCEQPIIQSGVCSGGMWSGLDAVTPAQFLCWEGDGTSTVICEPEQTCLSYRSVGSDAVIGGECLDLPECKGPSGISLGCFRRLACPSAVRFGFSRESPGITVECLVE